MLVVQHTDRLARGAGDEPGAADHLMELFFWLGRQRIDLWSVQSGGKVDRIRALLEGERNTEDSKRKSAVTRDGLRRRRQRGKPVGAMPLGYIVEKRVVEDEVVTKRVIDPATAPTVERIFDLVDAGASPGAIARRLNGAGITTRRGKPWEARALRRIVENPVYAGHGNYPAIIEPERWQEVNRKLRRTDPAAVQQRKGGRAPADDSFILRGIARCLVCGAALWTRRSPESGKRPYVWRHRRPATRVCTAPPIPATPFEEHVLSHLTAFVGDAEAWAVEQVRELEADRAARQQALDQLRREAADLDHRRALVLDDDTAAVAEGDPNARIILSAVERLDGQAATLAGRIADAEALLGEWHEADRDDALALLHGLRDVVQGKVANAEGTVALHDALASVLSGIWASLDDGRLRVEFRMVDTVGQSPARPRRRGGTRRAHHPAANLATNLGVRPAGRRSRLVSALARRGSQRAHGSSRCTSPNSCHR